MTEPPWAASFLSRPVRRGAAAVVLLALSVPLIATTAAAKCAAPPPMPRAIEDAFAVFVGTVTRLENMRRWATVEVSDVWKGPVAGVVEVRAGPKDPPGPISAASSVDRRYKRGIDYLFVVSRPGARFRDSSCSATTRYRPRLDRFRPVSAIGTSPSPTGTPLPRHREAGGGDSPSSVWWIMATVVGLASIAGMALRRHVTSR